jgi:hypothetical protein
LRDRRARIEAVAQRVMRPCGCAGAVISITFICAGAACGCQPGAGGPPRWSGTETDHAGPVGLRSVTGLTRLLSACGQLGLMSPDPDPRWQTRPSRSRRKTGRANADALDRPGSRM